MLNTTYDAIKSVLKADPSVSTIQRNRLLVGLRTSEIPVKVQNPREQEPRLIRRAEAARRLSCSLRLVDHLAATGVLTKKRLPGRVRARGILESDLVTLLTQKEQEAA
jgi:hypothetical protein